jgi:hypothetical protein
MRDQILLKGMCCNSVGVADDHHIQESIGTPKVHVLRCNVLGDHEEMQSVK